MRRFALPAGLAPVIGRTLAFVLIFMALQAGWEALRGTWVERLWIHDVTVGVATGLINLLTPGVQAVAVGSRITSPGGGLNVLLGCEGTDVLFMLTAAFCLAPLPWRTRWLGWLCGLVWVFALNQARIAALFYAFRADRELFHQLHSTAAPLLMVVLTGLFFHLWLQRGAPQRGFAAPVGDAQVRSRS